MLEKGLYSKTIVKVLSKFLLDYDRAEKGRESEFQNTYDMAHFLVKHLTGSPTFVFDYDNLRKVIKGDTLPQMETYQALIDPPHRACTYITQFSDKFGSVMAGALFAGAVLDMEKATDYVHIIVPKDLWGDENCVANPIVFSMVMHCEKIAEDPFKGNPIHAAGVNPYIAENYIKGQQEHISMFHSATAVMAYCLKHCKCDMDTAIVTVDLMLADGSELEAVSPYHEVTVLKENSSSSVIIH